MLPESIVTNPIVNAGPVRLKLPSGFVIAEVPKPSNEKLSLRVAQEKNQARAKLIREALDASYSVATSVLPIDFPGDVRAVIAEAKIAPENVPAATADGMSAFLAAAVDSHARVEPIARMQDEMNDANNEFYGIGATLRLVDGNAIVQQALENSPAQKFGVLANDIIIKVNGVNVEKMDLKEVVNQIRGPEGTPVTLSMRRKTEMKELTVVRGRIVIENVTVGVKEILGAKYIVVKLASFVDKFACNTIEKRIAEESALDPKIAGLIVDVRDNGGGLLQQAVCIGSLFVGEKTIVKSKDLSQDKFETYVGTRGIVTKLPMVTLINSNSASASEILAGAVQDYQRSWVVGERSFGKGSVQAPQTLTDKIYLFRTVSRFYQPSGRTNQVVGILPDFEAPAKLGMTADERYSLHETDIFPNALEAIGDPWVQPRPGAVSRIQSCRAKSKKAEAAYRALQSDDYQMLVAAEILACDNDNKVQQVQQSTGL